MESSASGRGAGRPMKRPRRENSDQRFIRLHKITADYRVARRVTIKPRLRNPLKRGYSGLPRIYALVSCREKVFKNCPTIYFPNPVTLAQCSTVISSLLITILYKKCGVPMNFITMTLFRETINITPPYYSLYLLFS